MKLSHSFIFSSKAVLLFTLTLGADLILHRYWNSSSRLVEANIPPRIHDVIAQPKASLFFGDSTVDFIGHDRDTRSSAKMFEDLLKPGVKVVDLSQPSAHSLLHAAYLKYLWEAGYRSSSFVILPVNLRSFSTSWGCNPSQGFMLERIAMSHGFEWFYWHFFKPMLVYKAIDLTDAGRECNSRKKNELKQGFRTSGLPEKLGNLETLFVIDYMYQLSPRDPLLVAFEEAIESAKKAGLSPIVYLTPIDHQEGERMLGEPFARQVGTNVALILNRLRAHGVPVLDLSRDLQHKHFYWGADGPHEHLDQDGRLWVARHVQDAAEALRAKPIPKASQSKTEF